jgi:AraC family transcriptional regulator of adaptative response/methylated-DNA-[protein]-cysteine methyltransferase
MNDIIRYAFGNTSLGDVMVAVSERGVTALEFIADRETAEKSLQSRFVDAKIVADQAGLSLLLSDIGRVVERPGLGSDIVLDLRGTPYESGYGICFARSPSVRLRATARSRPNSVPAMRET